MNIGEISSVSYQGQGGPSKISAEPVAAAEPVAKVEEVKSVEIAEKSRNNQDGNTENNDQANGQASLASLKKAVEKINANTENVGAVFGFHEATNRVTIKMVDKDTKETIKEFPAEETLDLIAKAWELAGIMVDERR